MLVDRPLNPEDLLGDENERGKLQFIIENIESLLSASTQGSLNIAISGDWGSGKTTYLKAIEGFYRDYKKCPVCFFEAWKYQDDENPLVPLLLEMREIDGLPPKAKGRLTNLIKPLVASGIAITDLLLKKTTGASIDDAIKALELAEKDYVKLVSRYRENLRQIAETIKNISENYKPENTELIWNNYCSNWKINDKKVFVLIVDDLDRLIPENAFTMIEALRFYFDVDNTLILMGLNDELINKHVCERYMTRDTEGEDFLEKIFHWKYELSYSQISDLHLREISRDYSNQAVELKTLLSSIDNLTHRKWIKLINRVEAGLRAYGVSEFYHIVFDAFLKELYPRFELFSRRFPTVVDEIREQAPQRGAEWIFRDAVALICSDGNFLTYPEKNYVRILKEIKSLLKRKVV